MTSPEELVLRLLHRGVPLGAREAAQFQPALAARYAAVEAKTGHRFRADMSMAEIIAEAEASPDVAAVARWEG